MTERKGPLTDSTFRKIVAALARQPAGIPVHPHMLRHATGFKLANDGHDNRAIQHYWGTRIFNAPRLSELSAQRLPPLGRLTRDPHAPDTAPRRLRQAREIKPGRGGAVMSGIESVEA